MLAAGYSRRFGRDKRRLRLADGRSLLCASLALPYALLDDVWLVLRPDDDVDELALPPGARLVQHPTTKQGMGYSLAAGIARLQAESPAQAVAIFLADMPAIRQDSLAALLREADAKSIVQPAYRGSGGHPVLFGRDFWPQLTTLSGDAGARTVLLHNADAVRLVELDDPGVLQDIDTQEDLAQL